MEKEVSQVQMDFSKSDLICGSEKEIVAFKLNQQYQRRLLMELKIVETERVRCLKELTENQYLMNRKSNDLEKLKKHFFTNLEPEYYNTLSRLYNEGRLKPSRSEGTRLNSAKLIAEKARQLNMTFGRRSVPISISPQSDNFLQHQFYLNRKKFATKIEISNSTNCFSDNLEIDEHGRKSRIIETDGWKKTIPLILETTIHDAININNPPNLNRFIHGEKKSNKIIQLNLNLNPMGTKFQSLSMMKPDISQKDIFLFRNESTKWVHQRLRNMSAHPKLGTKSSSNKLIEESQKTICISNKVNEFCRSASAFE